MHKDKDKDNDNDNIHGQSDHQTELQVLSNSDIMKKDFSPENQCSIRELKRRLVTRLKISWAFMSFLISMADVTVIIYLSYLHFSHSQDMLAWLMLLPILLNFIGIFTFLSNETERHEMEMLGCRKWKHLMCFPVIGPTVSSLRLFSYAFEEENAEKFERLESLLMKMKQYESFFRAAPEAFVQITFRIVTWTNSTKLHSEDYWTSVCIALCLFSLAESNIYASIMPAYYKLFNYSAEPDIWKVDMVANRWRVGLFIFNYLSIASRLFTDAIFRATACFYFENRLEFGEVIIISFIVQFLVRAVSHSVYQNTLMNSPWGKSFSKKLYSSGKVHDIDKAAAEAEAQIKPPPQKKREYIPVQEDMTGVYGAFTYSWRGMFMSFDFQDWSDQIVFFWFYVENVLLLVCSFAIIYAINYDLSDKLVYYVYAIASCISMFFAIILKYSLIACWRRSKAIKARKEVEKTKF